MSAAANKATTAACHCQGSAPTTRAASPKATRKCAAQNTAFHTAHDLAVRIKNDGPGQAKELTKAVCALLLLGLPDNKEA